MTDVSERVLVETSAALPLVHVAVAFPTGAALDPRDQPGLSRFAMRLARRTGAGLDPVALDERLDALGAALEVEVDRDAVVFRSTVVRRSLEAFTDLLARVIVEATLDDEEAGRLRRQTEAELLEGMDDDATLARRWHARALFPGHVDSLPIRGTRFSVSQMSGEAARAQYRRLVGSTEPIYGFAGEVSRDLAELIAARLERALGTLTRAAAPPPLLDDPKVPAHRRLLLVDKPERSQTQILIGGLGTRADDEDHFPLLVANTAFGGTFTSRLMQEVRGVRGWSYGASSDLSVERRRGPFTAWTFPAATDAAACVALELELLEALCREGLTDTELQAAVEYLDRSFVFQADTAARRAALALEARLLELPRGYYSEYRARVRAVTLEQANAALRRRLDPEALLVTVVGTASEVAEPIRRAIPRLAEQRIIDWQDD